MISPNQPNPFDQNTAPMHLAGRESVIQNYSVLLQRIKLGYPSTPIFMYGLRGVGKTVLLLRIEEMARELGYITRSIEADEAAELNFKQAIFNRLKEILLQLDTVENLKSKFLKALKVLQGIKLNYEGVEFGIDVEAALGEADSGNFQDDLLLLMTEIGRIAKANETPVCIIIDEIQNLNRRDLAALLSAMHRLIQVGATCISYWRRLT